MTEKVNEQVEEQEVEESKVEEVKTFSQEEVDKLLQSESDKRVSSALQTAQQKWEEEYKAKLEAEKSEAQKLAAMSEEERYKAELEKQREEFEAERKAFNKERLEAQTVKELSSNNLPVEFASYLQGETADEIKANIDTFKNQWTVAIEAAVEERVGKGTTPRSSNIAGSSITKEQFKEMSIHKKMELFNENPELYNQLK